MSRGVYSAILVLVCVFSTASHAKPLEHPPLGQTSSVELADAMASVLAGFDAQSDSAAARTGELRTHADYIAKHRFWRTFLEITGINAVQWIFNRYIVRSDEEAEQFELGWNTIEENMKNGFEWDDNKFFVNHFMHPFNGNMYYGAARDNGYDYYHSLLFCALGSWEWEHYGENNHPAINDWINTTYGGATYGEGLYRLSSMVLDNGARGWKRFGLEVAAGVLSPGRFVNRVITKEAWEVHQGPEDHRPEYLRGVAKAGARFIGDDHVFDDTQASAFASFAMEYGDPFTEPLRDPFDYFEFGLQFNFDSPDSIDKVGWIDVEGWLFGANEYNEDAVGDFWAAFAHFSYYSNEVFQYGAQEFGVGYLNSYKMGTQYHGHSRLNFNAILLGAAADDYVNITGRDYDYGPGLAAEAKWILEKNENPLLILEQDVSWIHTIDGDVGNHFIFLTDVRFDVPLHKQWKLGLEYIFYASRNDYDGLPDVNVSAPEFRASLAFDVD